MSRLEAWEARLEWPLTGVALLFLLAYATPIAWPTAPTALVSTCGTLVWVSWGVFVFDYLMRLHLADARLAFVRHNLLDLAVVILPVLRPLRLLRLVALLSILNRTGARELRGRVVTYAVGGTAILVTISALAVTEAERNTPDATIVNLGDGFWWAITTMTTVGYGDTYPTTTTGRAIAAGLMLGGIALLGVVTATLASWLVERVAAAGEVDEAATRAQVENLTTEVRELRRRLDPEPPDGG